MDPPFNEELLDVYSDHEIVTFVHNSLQIPSSAAILLSNQLVAKFYTLNHADDTLKAMEVASRLSIRTPPIKRVVRKKMLVLVIMERIKGDTLESAWARLGWLTTIRLSLQLRSTIRRLQSVTSGSAGSLVTGICRSVFLEDRFGLPARSTPADITYFLHFWASFTSIQVAVQRATGLSPPGRPSFRIPPTPRHLVLSHHDLAPRNILLDDSNRLWLIDWDLAGFYPNFFECAAMQNFLPPKSWDAGAQLRWKLFSWIAAGYFRSECELLAVIRSRFTRSALGRRFDLLYNGGPSGRTVK